MSKIIIVCSKGGVVLGETVSSIPSKEWRVVAIGKGMSSLPKPEWIQFEDANDEDSTVESVKRHVLGEVNGPIIVMSEGVAFRSGALDSMASRIRGSDTTVVTPPCVLSRRGRVETVFGATMAVNPSTDDRKFSEILGLRAVVKRSESGETLGVFPGCYGFQREWFENMGSFGWLRSIESLPVAISLLSWLLGGSCSVSDVPVQSAVWADGAGSWQEHLDKMRLAYSVFPPLIGNKVVMAMPECEAKTKAMLEMRTVFRDILADQRRLEGFSEGLASILSRFGVQT